MRIVVWKSPKALSGILRKLFDSGITSLGRAYSVSRVNSAGTGGTGGGERFRPRGSFRRQSRRTTAGKGRANHGTGIEKDLPRRL